MKKILFTMGLIAYISTIGYAQKNIKGNGILSSEIRLTETYDVISLIGSTEIEIIDGKEGHLTIIGDANLLSYVETTVHNNELTIKLKNNYNYNINKGLKVTVPVQNISKLSLVGSGDITSKKTLTDKNLMINLRGSGDINIDVNSDNVMAEVQGSGDLELKGNAKNFTATVKGSGDIIAKKLKTEISTLQVNGSGDIEVHVTKELHANVTGSGDISVTGNPTKVSQNVKGSGNITVK